MWMLTCRIILVAVENFTLFYLYNSDIGSLYLLLCVKHLYLFQMSNINAIVIGPKYTECIDKLSNKFMHYTLL